MGRKVYITSDMSTDERLIEVAEKCPQAPLLWPWLLTAFDDWGRGEASAVRLKARVFPMFSAVTVEGIEEALQAFSEAGLLILYEVGGKRYMAIKAQTWYRYQTHIRRSRRPGKDKMESDFPPPPEPCEAPQDDEVEPDCIAGIHGVSRGDQNTPQDPVGVSGDLRVPVPSTLPPFHPSNYSSPDGDVSGTAEAEPEASSTLSPDEVAGIWNEVCGDALPRCQKLSETRRKHIRRRIAEEAERRVPDWWRTYFARIRASPFCCGQGKTGWKATFDWAVRSEDVVLNVLEGKYDGAPRRSEVRDGVGRSEGGSGGAPERDFSDLYIDG